MSKHVIFGNFGNETLAMLAWARQAQLENVSIVSVDTGWAAQDWQQRVMAAEQCAREYGFNVIRLKPKLGFAELIKQQNSFPSTQYQWCAGFLKALPLIDWLDEHDPRCEALLMLGNRRALARGQGALPEFIEESEHFAERRIWHPLFAHDDEALKALIQTTGLDWLTHRSLECDPCVNNNCADFLRLSKTDMFKTKQLEQQLQQNFVQPAAYGDQQGIERVVQWLEKNPKSDTLSNFDMSCGSPFACGL